MNPKNKKKSESGLNWQKLKPKSSRRPSTLPAFKKRVGMIGRGGVFFSIIALLGACLWWGEKVLHQNTGPLDITGPGASIKSIEFSSDGVLSQKWFMNWFGPLRDRSLMDLDIEKIRMDLEKESQVVEARIRRRFPSTLEIILKEQSPIMVLRLKVNSGGYNDWLVSRDGSLYLGEGYTPARLSLLPSLSVPSSALKRLKNGRGFEPLEEVAQVAPLLELARREYPSFYRDWKIISYDLSNEFDPVAHILIRSGKVKRIRFSPKRFATQMERLHYLFLEPDFRKSRVIELIDLSHDRSVFAKI
jgi:hypothetical protein